MPLYEYECANGHRFEVIVKFSDPPLETCPTCGAPVHKLMSSPAFQFKGTGWYITDYARKGGEKKEGGETKDSGEKKEAKESKEAKETPASKSESTDSSSKSAAGSKPAASTGATTKNT